MGRRGSKAIEFRCFVDGFAEPLIRVGLVSFFPRALCDGAGCEFKGSCQHDGGLKSGRKDGVLSLELGHIRPRSHQANQMSAG